MGNFSSKHKALGHISEDDLVVFVIVSLSSWSKCIQGFHSKASKTLCSGSTKRVTVAFIA
jgi:hypothetical protein